MHVRGMTTCPFEGDYTQEENIVYCYRQHQNQTPAHDHRNGPNWKIELIQYLALLEAHEQKAERNG